MNSDWITVITFTYPEESYVLRSRLEAEGIEVNLLNEFTVQAYNFLSNAIGGIELQVRPDDYNRTLEIFKESGYLNQEIEPSFENTENLKVNTPAITIKCSHCGSMEVRKQKKAGWGFVLGFLLLGVPFFFPNHQFHCFDCGKDFKHKKS